MFLERLLEQSELKHLLKYDPETGLFVWRNPPTKNIKVGQKAGSLSSWGYIKIGLRRRQYYAHRLAWLYVYGEWPSQQIDHIDMDKTNNRIANLRDVSVTQNQHNKPIRACGASGLPGATYISGGKRKKRWAATIEVCGKRSYLGFYETKEAASAAYIKARLRLHVV